jgi:hypothetical protein
MEFFSEEDLRQSFLKKADFKLWCPKPKPGPVHAAMESTCSEGRADWVWATLDYCMPTHFHPMTYDLMQQPTCSRILAALSMKKRQTHEVIYSFAGVSRPTFRRLFGELIDAGLVHLKDKYVYLGPTFELPNLEICSFEFKLYNWRRALRQARRYRSFSHRVYVVMPQTGIRRAMNELELFKRSNIGLICHNSDGTSRKIVTSRKSKPTCTSHHIQAIGFLGNCEIATLPNLLAVHTR